jgi:hypothetical protein
LSHGFGCFGLPAVFCKVKGCNLISIKRKQK